METSVIALIVDSDAGKNRFQYLPSKNPDPYVAEILFDKRIKLNFELVAGGSEEFGVEEVIKYIKSTVNAVNGKFEISSDTGEVETWFESDEVAYNQRHLILRQLNGDISHLTIRDNCLRRDYETIKKWFYHLKIYDEKKTNLPTGDLIALVS